MTFRRRLILVFSIFPFLALAAGGILIYEENSGSSQIVRDTSLTTVETSAAAMREDATITITILMTIALSALLGSFYTWKSSGRVRALETSAEEIARGNLDAAINPDHGEFQVLAGALRDMASQLRLSRQRLVEQSARAEELESRFLLASRASRDTIWEWDPESKNLKFGERAWIELGYRENEIELTSDFWRERVHPEDLDRVTESYRSAIRDRQECWSVEYRLRRRDGSYSYIADRVSALYGSEGKLVRMVGSSSDVTESRNAKRALAESETSFRLLFADNPHPMWVYDPQTLQFMEVNDAAVDAYGYSHEEFLRMRITDIRPADEIPRLMEDLSRERPPLQHSREWRHMRKNGNIFFVDISSHELNFMGRSAVLVIALDITQRKEMEEKLRRSEVLFRSLIERSSDVTSVIDETGKLLYMSPSIARMGYTIEDMDGKTAFDLVHPDDAGKITDVIKMALLEPDVTHNIEIRFRDKSGVWRNSEWIVFNQLNVAEVRGLVVNSRDITERKELEAQFLRAQRMESIGILAGGIAHDLNNVLAPIMLSVDMLRDQKPGLKSLRVINTIETSARRGSDLIRQVLSFARGIAGEHTVVQLRHVVSEIEKIVMETFPRSIEIVTDVPRSLWPVTGDATQLHQVMMNLCVNSRDAMPAGGTILIRAGNVMLGEAEARNHPNAKAGPHILMEFSDNGAGIPSNDLEKIFQPFFTTKQLGRGTGLGLSTVSTIVKNHGGFIDVESKVGNGTTFRIHLPALMTAEKAKEESESNEDFAGHGELVLIVDDEKAVREFIKITLEAYGYRTVVASDGAEAMLVFAKSEGEIDLVVTDIMMPYMDGAATIAGLKKLDPDVKIIAVSGLVENQTASATQGIDGFVSKPFASGTLLRTIRSVLKDKPAK